MHSRPIIAGWLIAISAACVAGSAGAAPLQVGSSGSSVTATGSNDSPARPGSYPAERSSLEFDDKKTVLTGGNTPTIGLGDNADSLQIGASGSGMTGTLLAPGRTPETGTGGQLAHTDLWQPGVAPSDKPSQAADVTVPPQAPSVGPASSPPPSNAAVWETMGTPEFGIIDTPEFAAGVALLGAITVLLLIMRSGKSRRRGVTTIVG